MSVFWPSLPRSAQLADQLLLLCSQLLFHCLQLLPPACWAGVQQREAGECFAAAQHAPAVTLASRRPLNEAVPCYEKRLCFNYRACRGI